MSFPERNSETRCRVKATLVEGEGARRIVRHQPTIEMGVGCD